VSLIAPLVAPLARATDSARRLRASLHDHRLPLLWVAGVRGAVGLIAIPLAPVLYEDHLVWVVFLRPTKEVLLAAGFLMREGDVTLLPVVAAAVPIVLGGVWLMYVLGVLYRREVRRADLPGPAERLLPPERIERLATTLKRDGVRVVFLGRLAIFPSTLMAAAAGVSELPPRRFLLADGLGAAASVALTLLAGFVLGEAHDSAGPWLSVVGAVALLGLLFLVGRRLRRD
jgi:membrane protein DedA with SNARE-associated domain